MQLSGTSKTISRNILSSFLHDLSISQWRLILSTLSFTTSKQILVRKQFVEFNNQLSVDEIGT